jgi:hypothetical protein
MRTADGHTAVDAAHISPWFVSHNDGLAFMPASTPLRRGTICC